jgi:hypothetical protein
MTWWRIDVSRGANRVLLTDMHSKTGTGRACCSTCVTDVMNERRIHTLLLFPSYSVTGEHVFSRLPNLISKYCSLEVFTVVNRTMKIAVLWVLTTCIIKCAAFMFKIKPILIPWRWEHHFSPNSWFVSIREATTPQKIIIIKRDWFFYRLRSFHTFLNKIKSLCSCFCPRFVVKTCFLFWQGL